MEARSAVGGRRLDVSVSRLGGQFLHRTAVVSPVDMLSSTSEYDAR